MILLNLTRLPAKLIYDYLWGECSLVRWLGDRLCWLFYWGSVAILVCWRIRKCNRLVLKRWSKSWSWWLGLRVHRTGLCENWFFHWTTGYVISWRWLVGLYWSWFRLKRGSYWCPFSIDDFWCLKSITYNGFRNWHPNPYLATKISKCLDINERTLLGYGPDPDEGEVLIWTLWIVGGAGGDLVPIKWLAILNKYNICMRLS